MTLRIMDTADRAIDAADRHIGHLVEKFEEEVGFKPIKVAAWGLATASVLTAVAAGLAATAAAAGAYVALRAARRARAEKHGADQTHQHRPQSYRTPGSGFMAAQNMAAQNMPAHNLSPQNAGLRVTTTPTAGPATPGV